jgi:hypothetical protein
LHPVLAFKFVSHLKKILFQSGYYLNEFGGDSTRTRPPARLRGLLLYIFNYFYDVGSAI